MRGILRCATVAATCLAAGSPAYSQAIYKCAGANGETVFSQQACPDGSAGDHVEARNAPPSGGNDVVPWAQPDRFASSRRPSESRATIVGDFKCSDDLSDQQIRSAIVKRKVLIGMNESEVRRALGTPIRINRSSHGKDQWVYDGLYLYMDKNGCMVSWN